MYQYAALRRRYPPCDEAASLWYNGFNEIHVQIGVQIYVGDYVHNENKTMNFREKAWLNSDFFIYFPTLSAGVVEMVDTHVWGACGATRTSSILVSGTILKETLMRLVSWLASFFITQRKYKATRTKRMDGVLARCFSGTILKETLMRQVIWPASFYYLTQILADLHKTQKRHFLPYFHIKIRLKCLGRGLDFESTLKDRLTLAAVS